MKKTFSKRQLKYAYGLMNEQKTKYQIAIEAGFSPSTARVPKVIEKSKGFKLAVAHLAGEVHNTTMQILFELQARDLQNENTKTLLHAVDVLSKSMERYQVVSQPPYSRV